MPANEVQAYTATGESLGVRAAGIRYQTPDGRVLLARRAATASDYPGHWAFIAGGVEAGETPVAAAVRESLEEIGRAPETLPKFLEVDTGFALFAVETEPFEPTLNHEHDAAEWVAPDALPSPLHPGVARQLGVVATAEDSARTSDANGWFEVQGNPISKAGVFPYLGRSIRVAPDMPQPDPARAYNVYRPAEELADPACIESFRLIPWTDEHTMLGPESLGMTPAERKGVQGVIGENVYFDGEYLRANIKCFAEALAQLIQSGKRELSAGYRCVYEYAPGVAPDGTAYDYVQRRIRGNHVALVDEGRCGPEVAVLDEAVDFFTFTFDAQEATAMPDEPKKTIDVNSLTVAEFLALSKEMAPILAQLQKEPDGDEPKPAPAAADTDPAATPAANPDEDTPTMDARDKELADLRAQVAALTAKPDAAAILADRRAAAALASDLSRHIGTFDHADKSLAEVAQYGAEKLGIACDAAEAVAVVKGYLAGAKPQAPAVAVGQDSAPTAGGAVAAYLTPQE